MAKGFSPSESIAEYENAKKAGALEIVVADNIIEFYAQAMGLLPKDLMQLKAVQNTLFVLLNIYFQTKQIHYKPLKPKKHAKNPK